jgi:hypothetical protein
MLNAPFLELAYFVGEANLKQAIDKVREMMESNSEQVNINDEEYF